MNNKSPANGYLLVKQVKRVLVMIVGGSVLAIGVALIALPGPALVVIPLGLAILAIEFAWARRWLRSTRAAFGLKPNKGGPGTRGALTAASIQRRAAFLFRQLRRTGRRRRGAGARMNGSDRAAMSEAP